MIGGLLCLSFTILHEIGHVDWNINRSRWLRFWREGDRELYCDTFAYEALRSHYGEEEAFLLLRLFGSAEGFNKGELR
jgi:hypothetical protein